jgi:beta-glucosidase
MKNDGGVLPLRRGLKRIAVIGPNADVAQLGDYTPIPFGFEPVTPLAGLRRLAGPETEIVHVRGAGIDLHDTLAIPGSCLQTPEGRDAGLRAEYFNNPDLKGEPTLVRIDPQVDFDWSWRTPDERITSASFSVRWTGLLRCDQSFDGHVGVQSGHDMKLWIDDKQVAAIAPAWPRNASPFRFEAGRAYVIRAEFRVTMPSGGVKHARIGWDRGQLEVEEAVKLARASDAVIVCAGEDSIVVGEGRDRADLRLPGRQRELIRALCATGKPVVLVLQIGRALTLDWEAQHVPAIVNCWFAGEAGGQAVAEAIFGDVNPAGRLPVTFPRSVAQLPIYYNELVGGHGAYGDQDHQPLFTFGHGLSYTRFEYSDLHVEPATIGPDDRAVVRVTVRNAGERAGDEVVQLYLRDRVSSVARPDRELRGLRRIRLKPGQTQSIEFEVGPSHLRLLDARMKWVVEPGEFDVMVGGGLAPAVKGRLTIERR